MKNRSLFIVSVAAITWLAGPALAEDVTETWARQCQKCHAEDGSGNTKMGKKLELKDYTDPAVQAEMTDEDMITITKDGVVNDAGKQMMKAYVETLTEEQIVELVALIRTFAKS